MDPTSDIPDPAASPAPLPELPAPAAPPEPEPAAAPAASAKKPLSRTSGAAKRRAAKDALGIRLASEVADPAAYTVLGKPPVDDPATGLKYVRQVQLVALGEIAGARLGQLEKWRLIKDMSATIGMTHNRAALEERLKRLELSLKEQRRSGAVRIAPASEIARPATARQIESAPPAVQDEPPAVDVSDTAPPVEA